MPGLNDLNAAAQLVTGPQSVQDAVAAISQNGMIPSQPGVPMPAGMPAGADPLADGSAAPSVAGGVPGMVPNPGLSPEARAAIGMQLSQILQSLPAPSSEAEAAVGVSLQNALQALSM